MTTPANPADTATTSATTTTDAADTETTPPTEPANANSEAARYRTQLRAAETERDALAERITGYQRRDCETVVADLLAQPADLWDIGQADLADYLNEDGTPNEDAVRAAAAALIGSRPGLAKNPGETGPKQWGQGNARPPSSSRGGWADVINRR